MSSTLHTFDVANNLISGTVPTQLGNLLTLGSYDGENGVDGALYLNDLYLSGTLPEQLGRLTSLPKGHCALTNKQCTTIGYTAETCGSADNTNNFVCPTPGALPVACESRIQIRNCRTGDDDRSRTVMEIGISTGVFVGVLLLVSYIARRLFRRQKKQLLEVEVELDNLNPEAEKARELGRLRTRMAKVLKAQGGSAHRGVDVRFTCRFKHLRFGERAAATHGILELLNANDPEAVLLGVAEGVDAIEREVMANGTEVDKECFDYVARRAAGSSSRLFQNSMHRRDCDASGVRADRLTPSGEGMLLADFRSHPHAAAARLTLAHVLALRLYSTAVFTTINQPLRVATDEKAPKGRAAQHPFPVTVMLLTEAIKKLRAVPACAIPGVSNQDGIQASAVELWRGLKDSVVHDEFLKAGGTTHAPMSTTRSLEVAMDYSTSISPMLMRLKVDSFMQVGADLSFIAAFPDEDEVLYPPLTYLKPLGPANELKIGDIVFTVVDVEPFIG